jgi:hypothetical protein
MNNDGEIGPDLFSAEITFRSTRINKRSISRKLGKIKKQARKLYNQVLEEEKEVDDICYEYQGEDSM